MNHTSIKQSINLVNLGLDPKTADMRYEHEGYYDRYNHHAVAAIPRDEDIPCWSTEALLNVLPVLEKDEKFYPFLGKHEESGYICKYACSEYNGTLHWFIKDTQLEACYEMVEYVLKNEIRNKGNKRVY